MIPSSAFPYPRILPQRTHLTASENPISVSSNPSSGAFAQGRATFATQGRKFATRFPIEESFVWCQRARWRVADELACYASTAPWFLSISVQQGGGG